MRIHAHQFRHTVGTRLINAGVPQHVIQKLLGHASPRMTARYAQIHDQTVRDAFDRYCQQRVNTAGEPCPSTRTPSRRTPNGSNTTSPACETASPTATAAVHRSRTARIPTRVSPVPTSRPLRSFSTSTGSQASTNAKLIARADANGQFRLAENLRRFKPVSSGSFPLSRTSTTRRMHDPSRQQSPSPPSAAARRHNARHKASQAIERLDRQGEPITFAAVAAAADVSRSWLYRQHDLRELIDRLRAGKTRPVRTPAIQRATDASLRQRLDAARDEIVHLRDQNAQLRQRLERQLGEQRLRRTNGVT